MSAAIHERQASSRPTAVNPFPPSGTPVSIGLPLAFICTGLLSLLTGVVWLLLRPELLTTYHYNQYIIAVTHLVVLGWICSVVMGTMYQLVPVALETQLYSARLARWHFALHTVGFVGMVWMFNAWNMKQVGHLGCVLATGVGLFVYNIGRTLRRVPKWTITATGVAFALFWISAAIIAGLSIAIAKCTYESTEGLAAAGGVRSLVGGLRSVAGFMSQFHPISAMHAHAHLGAVGFFMILTVGVSYKLLPMFMLSEVQSHKRATASIVLLALGLAGAFVTILLGNPLKLAFAAITVGGIATYGWEIIAIVRARKRRHLDWALKYFLTALALLAPLSAIALVLSWPGLPLTAFTGQLENIYGLLGLLGLFTFAIIGMLYKILPFLIWVKRYGSHIGKAKVPALTDMFSVRLQETGYWSYLAGLVVVCAAILAANNALARCGCAFLLSSVISFALNVALMLSHFVKAKLQPFSIPSRAALKTL
jgi:cbb3-type cytochrome oxidase subunit 1